MKIEVSKSPENLVEHWPGEYEVFSWMEYVSAIPQTISIITTYKENGKANANLHAWQSYNGDKGGFYVITTLMNSSHSYKNILKSREFVVNFPVQKDWDKCVATINNNAEADDEIVQAGFTIEQAKKVKAPRITECFLNLECILDWDRALHANSIWHVFAGKVQHIAISDEYVTGYKRYSNNGFMLNLHGPMHPVTGKMEIGMIGVVEPKFKS